MSTDAGSPSRRPEVLPDDRRLIDLLEELLGGARGAPAVVRDLRRTPGPFTTLWPTEILEVELGGGEHLSLFAKHLGVEGDPHPDKRRPDRELLVYERLLDGEGPAAPRYYGSRVDEGAERFSILLLLEHVADWDLRYQALEYWTEAARALALLHRTFAGRVDDHDFLLSLDRDHLLAWARRAAAAVEDGPAGLGRRLEAIVASHAPVADLLTAQPRTLVHNDLAPKNVLADRSQAPARICLVDWEVAGAGPGALDLVHLAYGLEAAQEERLIDAYRDALDGAPVLPSSSAEIDRLLAAARLHEALYRLAHPHLWRDRPALAEEWTAEAERAREAV